MISRESMIRGQQMKQPFGEPTSSEIASQYGVRKRSQRLLFRMDRSPWDKQETIQVNVLRWLDINSFFRHAKEKASLTLDEKPGVLRCDHPTYVADNTINLSITWEMWKSISPQSCRAVSECLPLPASYFHFGKVPDFPYFPSLKSPMSWNLVRQSVSLNHHFGNFNALFHMTLGISKLHIFMIVGLRAFGQPKFSSPLRLKTADQS
ncbi:uncharacterized protein CLUP02_10538 [Colletotrichum lupini]|uniref:Uncharacterized protein n=1 Tax=Colletotrichum lupini TaxID=145971 RepID=A0A9Q8WJG0_9PEZI|nr:uncharacterized protein CLUP02_10538 [Colletotrichum lupini]UQC85042.1 hypothetical protein CLUP02_10538 [Colletotrichum lupini]